MTEIRPDEIEVLIANAKKPTSFSNYSFPLNDLDDRLYEVLTYSIYKRRIQTNDSNLQKIYDDILLMQGVGEKGMDCALLKNNKIVATIQCKKYSKNLSETIILPELIKFAIHFHLDRDKFASESKFKYLIATTTGYTSKALHLPIELKTKGIQQLCDFPKVAKSVLRKYKEFHNIDFEDIQNKIPTILASFEYELVRHSEFNTWIHQYPEILDTFFETTKVIDNHSLEELRQEISNKFDLLGSPKDTEAIANFIKKYKTSCLAKLNLVNFIGFDLHRHRQKPTEITLTDLFVQPTFRQRIIDKNSKVQSVVDKDIRIANVFKSEKNIILLGDPGAGKSLLVKYIIIQILNGSADKIGLKSFTNTIPFRIELRKYNEVRENKSIIEYLADLLTREYQATISPAILEDLISTSDSFIFFDGLDEIFNVTHKNKTKEYIESFSATFPKSKCIVTSRFIGYHEMRFNSKKFDEFAIQRFNKKQIDDLVEKFYATQIANQDKRRQIVNNCKVQIETDVDDDLKSNPLIMTLILVLTFNNIVIPDSKLEIYEACTKTLVDTIDIKEKELKIEMPVKHKRVVFASLAYWQYELLSRNQEVSYDRAVKSIADLLYDRREATEYPEAEEKAKKFLEYAEKRSIYFEDNFTHKTFLEYYTADYLYINYFTKGSDSAKKKAITIITNYLPNAFWYIVFELLFTRIDKDQFDTDLMDEIFTKQIESNSLSVFYFLISNLSKFTNVSDDLRKKILKKTILLCLKGEKVTQIRRGFQFEENSLIAKINKLRNDDQNFELLQQVILELEQDVEISEKDMIELYIFVMELQSFDSRTKSKHLIRIKNESRMKELSYKDLYLFSQLSAPKNIREEILPLETLLEQIEFFGTKSLFGHLNFRHRDAVQRIGMFDIFMIGSIDRLDVQTFQSTYHKLLEAGVRHSQILEHVKNTRIYFYFRNNGIEKVVQFYLKLEDIKCDEIILGLIRNDSETKFALEKLRESQNHPKFKTIDKLFRRDL